MALRVDLLESLVEADAIHAAWDELAVRASRPYCAPDWLLAWWRHAAPTGAAMRLLTAWDGGTLVGLAPLYVTRRGRASGDYAAMAARFSAPTGLLCDPERQEEARATLVAALAGQRQRPALLRLDEEPAQSELAGELAAAWPGRTPWSFLTEPTLLPIVDLDGLEYDAWLLERRSAKFRQKVRRQRRRLEEDGGRFETAAPEEPEPAIDAYLRLHGARWDKKGGSDALVPGIREILTDAAAKLGPQGRMRLQTIRTDEAIIAVMIVVAAGTEACAWSSGYDEEWKRFSPSTLMILQTMMDSAGRGERRVSLGPGAYPYKLLIADRSEEIGGVTLVPRGGAYARMRLRMLGPQLRWALSRRLTPEVKGKLRKALPR